MFSTTYNPIHLSPPTDTWSTFEFRDPLHSLPPRVTGAILEVHNKTGAPVEIVTLVALSAMSTALHGYTIRPPNGRLMPMSLYCMGIGPPVCGKSAAMREFYRAIREFDANLEARRARNPEQSDHPALRDLLQRDVTWSSLLEVLDGKDNGVTLEDDDCIDQLKSDFMKKRGKLNRFFDGPVKESLIRRDQDPLAAYNPSIGICFLTQPEIHSEHQVAIRYIERKSGLASRFLYAHTLAGRGPERPLLPTPNLDGIQRLVTWFLEQRVQRRLAGNSQRIELTLSPEAQWRWEELKRSLDQRLHGDLQPVQDSAARATEKTWRIAAALHCFNAVAPPEHPHQPLPPIPPIPPDAIDAAWAYVECSLAQFHKVFPPPEPKPPRPSRVRERQLEELRVAKGHLHDYLRRRCCDTMSWSQALELSWLSEHKFKTVVAHMKSMDQVELLGGKDRILRFSSHFFAEMGFERSIASQFQL
ncbi:hypothetical protein CSC62_06615 [Pseudoxanthomonas jiangsuensis]|uniref:DUF3987 domain-containing protein n=1 Tax=Pseudoxanthomonas jiangsuensis TaxID=619688 RepID=UPI001391BA87|nr:DUF3987 domain-containing protein [Pseudoxanthomonas jiangsuensis]KAF1698047.1 hypothetical protein CSC62_06615 [Pseudoxanthomonas jiangsuensis]